MASTPRPIFFDLYNTLLHFDFSVLPSVELDGETHRTTMVGVQQALQRQGCSVALEELLRAALESRRQLALLRGPEHREQPSLARFQLVARRLGIERPGVPELMVEAHMEGMFRMMHCPPETVQVLAALSRRRMFVASNFDHAGTVRRALREFAIERFFEAVFISDELGWRKPGRHFFQEITRRAGVVPAECLFVGDDPAADIEGASSFGFRTVWLKPPAPERRPAPAPDWEIQSLPEILQVLAG